MGIFRRIGRNVEEFRQEARRAANAEYECAACGALLDEDADACPECGEDAVGKVERDGDED